MKYTFLLAAAIAAVTFATPTPADARDYCSGERRCIGYTNGCPIYQEYRIIGYDRCGRPIGQWITVRTHSGYPHHQGYRPSCPPPPPHCVPGHSPYRRSGVGLFFSFR